MTRIATIAKLLAAAFVVRVIAPIVRLFSRLTKMTRTSWTITAALVCIVLGHGLLYVTESGVFSGLVTGSAIVIAYAYIWREQPRGDDGRFLNK